MWINEYKILKVSDISAKHRDYSTIVSSHMLANEESSDDALIYYVVGRENFSITLSDGEESFSIVVEPDSLVAFKDPFRILEPNVNVTEIPDYKTRGFGAGTKKFLVTATINDQYVIPISADTPEQAIALSNSIPIHLWDHPDIEPHLTERVLIRMARWGNLDAKELA